MLAPAMLVVLCMLVPELSAQPQIARNGVRNAASQIPTTHEGMRLAPGSRITIDGLQLATVREVRIGNAAVRILSKSPQRIEAVLPTKLPPGSTTLQIIGATIATAPVTIASTAPGLYAVNGLGWGAATADGLAIPKGSTITLEGTGFATTAPTARILVGDTAVTARLSPTNKPGIVSLRIPIPATAPAGCHVPVQAATEGTPTNTVSIAIAPCTPSDPDRPSAQAGRTYGFVVRTLDIATQASDVWAAFFRFERPTQAGPLMQPPPDGVCHAATFTVDEQQGFLSDLPSLLFRGPPQWIAGAPHLNLHAGNQNLRIPIDERGTLSRRLRPPLPPGKLIASSPGSAVVQPFAVPATDPVLLESVQFPQADANAAIAIAPDRPLPLQWVPRADAPDHPLLIVLLSANPEALLQGFVLCRVPASRRSFTIEPRWLRALPPTLPGAPPPLLRLVTLPPSRTAIRATGLDQGAYIPAAIYSAPARVLTQSRKIP